MLHALFESQLIKLVRCEISCCAFTSQEISSMFCLDSFDHTDRLICSKSVCIINVTLNNNVKMLHPPNANKIHSSCCCKTWQDQTRADVISDVMYYYISVFLSLVYTEATGPRLNHFH